MVSSIRSLTFSHSSISRNEPVIGRRDLLLETGHSARRRAVRRELFGTVACRNLSHFASMSAALADFDQSVLRSRRDALNGRSAGWDGDESAGLAASAMARFGGWIGDTGLAAPQAAASTSPRIEAPMARRISREVAARTCSSHGTDSCSSSAAGKASAVRVRGMGCRCQSCSTAASSDWQSPVSVSISRAAVFQSRSDGRGWRRGYCFGSSPFVAGTGRALCALVRRFLFLVSQPVRSIE